MTDIVVLSETDTPSLEELQEMKYIFTLMDLSGFVVQYGWSKVEEDLKALLSREAGNFEGTYDE